MRKGIRRKMYENVEMLNKDFDQYAAKNAVSTANLKAQIESLGFDFPTQYTGNLEYLALIMNYMRPGTHYTYEAGANFGKLLKNPQQEKLIGDCNQIVTFYSYLYSRKFPISDLEIKLLPKHVCLHFKGIDIEATNGTFQKYEESEETLPITELMATNLLDTTDAEEETVSIDPRTIVKRAQFAYKISSKKDLVKRNLDIAYRNVGITLLNRKEFKSAIFFFEKLGDQELLKTSYRNAAIHYMNLKDYKAASFYAHRSGDTEIEKQITYNQAVAYYNKKNYAKALQIFRQVGDERMEKACYQGQYNQLARKIATVKTVADARKYRSTYQKMVELAHKMGDEQAANSVKDILSKM